MRFFPIFFASVGAVTDVCTERESGQLLTNVLLTATSLDPDDFESPSAFIAEATKQVLLIDSPCVACASAYVPALVAAVATGCDKDISKPECITAFNAVSDAMTLCMLGEAATTAPEAALCSPQNATRVMTDSFLTTLTIKPAAYTTNAAYLAAVDDAIFGTEIPCAACAVDYLKDVKNATAITGSACATNVSSELCVARMNGLADTFTVCALGIDLSDGSGVASLGVVAAILAAFAIDH